MVTDNRNESVPSSAVKMSRRRLFITYFLLSLGRSGQRPQRALQMTREIHYLETAPNEGFGCRQALANFLWTGQGPSDETGASEFK